MSETPLTDKESFNGDGYNKHVKTAFAQSLERKLNAARAEIEALKTDLQLAHQEMRLNGDALQQARADVKELVKAAEKFFNVWDRRSEQHLCYPNTYAAEIEAMINLTDLIVRHTAAAPRVEGEK